MSGKNAAGVRYRPGPKFWVGDRKEHLLPALTPEDQDLYQCPHCQRVAQSRAELQPLVTRMEGVGAQVKDLRQLLRDFEAVARSLWSDERRILREIIAAGAQHVVCSGCGILAGPYHNILLTPEPGGEGLVCDDCLAIYRQEGVTLRQFIANRMRDPTGKEVPPGHQNPT